MLNNALDFILSFIHKPGKGYQS